ncbi:MAG: class II glutamine amidotransferase [Deltaproteobacteria bacterium]|nr:class II glutamine amidotransferase [Deltaproteobacteria bacterium]
MPSLLAMSFEGELSPSFDLRCLHPGRQVPDGWGIGFYPGREPSATVFKEPAPPPGSARSELVKAWERVASSVFVTHVRSARWGQIADANTQPFARSWGRRDWLFVHSGSLATKVELGPDAIFEPVGSTDTEAIFCDVMTRVARAGWKSLREADLATLQGWLREYDDEGTLTCALTDGSDVLVYADRQGAQPVWIWELKPPYDEVIFGDDEVQVDLTRRGAKARKGVIASTHLLSSESDVPAAWRPLAPGGLMLVRQGALLAELPGEAALAPAAPVSPPGKAATAPPPGSAPPAGLPAAPRPRVMPPSRPQEAPRRRLEIRHRTVYRYAKPVERSTHIFRFEPIQDRLQRVAAHQLNVSVKGQFRDYSDVFGNRVRRLVVERPFTEMVIESMAHVVALDTDPLELRPLHARTTIPVNWMPWQRHMLQPYLLPPELPESQLVELYEYAMSFVERNGYDIVDTLLDINQSIYRDYEYKQGSTNVHTTAFEVYTTRRGVCQDFTNVFICLARLLGIPARYVCGYLYTGPKHENRAMAEATHAWAQVYLPESGWKGFDPTNGVLTQTDHVRVAIGRNYLDATPTSGTIFVGGGAETLEVAVTVEEQG